MLKDYRKLKNKKLTELVATDRGICYRRKTFDKNTGDEIEELREDIVDVDVLNAKIVKLQEEIADLQELVSDLGKL